MPLVSAQGDALDQKLNPLLAAFQADKAKKALGRKFDIRKFHDACLLSGGVPLTLPVAASSVSQVGQLVSVL